MKSLLRELTIHDYGLPSYSLITRVRYMACCKKGYTVYIDRNDRKNLNIEITDDSGSLQVSLRPLRRALEVRQKAIQDSQEYGLSFSRESILQFVEDVHDQNTIHREAPYVVPGLMILESLWQQFGETSQYSTVDVQYYSPTLADDRIQIQVLDDNRRIEAYAGSILLFVAQFDK